jgi:purine-binding chemotaxis protein CheW
VGEPSSFVLLIRSAARVCAIPIEHVRETMRPLRVEPISAAPPFVRGAAIVRGAAMPVIDLGAFLGAPGEPAPTARFVVVSCGERLAALAVEGVIGVADLGSFAVGSAPLLGDACAGSIESLGVLDGKLLLVLRAAKIVPDSVWRALDGRSAANEASA